MNKEERDELYLIVDFLEDQIVLHYEMYGSEFEEDRNMLNKTIKVVKSLIKE